MVPPPLTTVADPAPVARVLDDPRPPLPRRRRVQQQDRRAADGAPASQDSGVSTRVKAAKSKRLTKPGSLGPKVDGVAVAGAPPVADQEVPAASGASSSSQAVAPSYMEQALQLTQMKVIRDLPRTHGTQHRSPTPKSWWPKVTVVQEGGSSGSNVQTGEVKDDH